MIVGLTYWDINEAHTQTEALDTFEKETIYLPQLATHRHRIRLKFLMGIMRDKLKTVEIRFNYL